MKRPSLALAGLGFWPVPLGNQGLQSGARCMEKLNMGNRDENDQFNPETKTRPSVREVELPLEEFWRHQLNRLKEYAESQVTVEQPLRGANQ